MTDDPKVTPIGIAYKPDVPDNDTVALQWSVVQLSEEIERLGRATQGMTRLLKSACEKLDALLEKKD